MGKKAAIYIVIALITVGALMLLQYNKPKEINWYESYVSTHKIPYGTYVFNQIIPKLFGDKAQQVNIPPFEYLQKNKGLEGTYFFVNNTIIFNKAELESLLEWTSQGNTLFIASKTFEEQLLDTLNLDLGSIYGGFEVGQSQNHNLLNPNLVHADSVIFNKATYTPYFNKIDTLKTVVLGKVVTELSNKEEIDKSNINIITQPFGKGKVILSTFPEAFTNYFILKDSNKDYTTGILSYLDDSKNIYIDNHYKSGKSFYTSPMYLFLNTKELKWAYYTALIGVLIYIVFEGKRKQRAVPVVVPLQNQTLAFTRTISDMYFEKGDQKSIVEHKINYFLDGLRSEFYLGNIVKEDDFYTHLAARSGQSFESVKSLFNYMEQLRNKEQVTDSELIKLNTLIQKFKAKADGK
ncbi:DUF4350 domain-containing protein [Maribacter aestuarii]|uniref:DUF4350 domain-containing protein n=1 Tax=Maribacter aestuarii TaxID=1130723 RepID=UPI00248D2B91|nr:DUF4350 domain-containing protein [Maribacter aestuarii]